MSSGATAITVVVPVIDEARLLPAALASARAPGVEIVVADGGSRDRSREIAAAAGARVIEERAGRAHQMNAGARVARAPLLLFLHGDTVLPAGWTRWVHAILARPGVAAGAFRLAFLETDRALRLVERGANLRSRWLGLPYGDQALFTSAARFSEVGGYPEIELLEDLALVLRLRRRGRIAIAPASVRTSARRFRRLGAFRTTALNQAVLVGFGVGIAPSRLGAWYRRAGGADDAEARPADHDAGG